MSLCGELKKFRSSDRANNLNLVLALKYWLFSLKFISRCSSYWNVYFCKNIFMCTLFTISLPSLSDSSNWTFLFFSTKLDNLCNNINGDHYRIKHKVYSSLTLSGQNILRLSSKCWPYRGKQKDFKGRGLHTFFSHTHNHN